MALEKPPRSTAMRQIAGNNSPSFLRLGDSGVDLAESVIQPRQAHDFLQLLVLGSDVGNYADEAIAPALRLMTALTDVLAHSVRPSLQR